MAAAGIVATPLHGPQPGLWGLFRSSDLLPAADFTHFAAYIHADGIGPVSLLEELPGELILEVFKHLDLASVFSLARACKQLHEIYADNRSYIVMSILPSDPNFSPVDGLFRAAAATPGDLDVPWGTWLDKEIRFKLWVLCKGRPLPKRVRTSQGWELMQDQAAPNVTVRYLDDDDVDRILGLCKVVKGWERIFPHYRFSQRPDRMRMLRAHESRRLRGSIYAWMRYHYYFHGDLPRPSRLQPANFDMRCNLIRVLDSGEVSELEDLWTTVKSAVISLCPSLAAVLLGAESTVSEKQAAKVAWGATEQEHFLVVSTMLKLGPERLLYFINHSHEYSKARLVDEIRRERPGIESDIESLTMAVHAVHWERYSHCISHNIPVPPSTAGNQGDACGGILDWGDVVESLRGNVEAGFGLRWQADDEEDEDESHEVCGGYLGY